MSAEQSAAGIPGVAAVRKGEGGLDVLDISAPAAQARIYLHGAHLTHWHPFGGEPVIFTSAKSAYAEGRAIRGGVPVCFPWFGPREGHAQHGFVRNKTWKLDSTSQTDDGGVRAVFSTRADEDTRRLWPHDFTARMTCTVGRALEMELTVANVSAGPFTFSEALHTYFEVRDARRATVAGLDGVQYRDFPDRTQLVTQRGAVRFTGETDRVFVNTRGACVLDDPAGRRRITVEKEGSGSTVVWNPWIAKAAAMADFGDDEWERMVCIETANAFENSITLAPGASHSMSVRIRVEPLPQPGA